MGAAIPLGAAWTSPFAKWGGTLAEVSSLEVAAAVTSAALDGRGLDPAVLDSLVLGWTVPQPDIFYGAPSLATAIGASGIAGPMVSQACATSALALRTAARQVESGDTTTTLVVLTDRTSNGPLLVYPQPGATGGAPGTEHWVLDSFARDPGTGQSMLATAEAVAREEGIERAALDDLTALRHTQYADRPADFTHLVPVVIERRRSTIKLTEDEGVQLSTRETLGQLRPATPDGLHSYGTQTHPADGTAGAIVADAARARELSRGEGIVELLGFGEARVEAARMPKAPVPAAHRALAAAGLSISDVDLVTTHNPFAVNDLYFSTQTGFPVDRMNTFGCSLVFGHPQAPTGMRSVVELIAALRQRGGGVGLFTGCAAGDVGSALVIKVTD
ncbi:thiolase family protein [Mycobacterium sp. OAE908]|uniref:thiolase family protein n=1 Tax=Mycobacterium sp. OAE908 TaxID=2817899 RepID=UPI001AE20982